jgi:Zn-dependent protease with chaperone function
MLSELWSFIKLSFMKRLYLYALQYFSLILFILSPLLGLATFLIASTLLIPSFASLIDSQIKLLFVKKYEADESIKDEVNEVADGLGVKIKKILVAKGLVNAYVRFSTLVLGEGLLNLCDPDLRRAVISHELVHVKEKHIWLRMMGVVTVSAAVSWNLLRLNWPIIFNEMTTQILVYVMMNFALLACVTIAMITPNWYMEIRADQGAIRKVGKAPLISALLAIVTKEEFKVPSEDHPAMSERIKLILKYNPEKSLSKRMRARLSRLSRLFSGKR